MDGVSCSEEGLSTRLSGVSERIKALLMLTKPRISAMGAAVLLASALLASGGELSVSQVIVLIGIGLTVMGSTTLNNCFDCDIDRRMKRTQKRPLVTGAVDREAAWVWGGVLTLFGTALVAGFGKPVTVFLNSAAVLIYVGIYTPFLKRRVPWANEVGSLAGALPPVLGWLVGGGEGWTFPSALFLFVFFWQGPHFWAMAQHFRQDYVRVGLPVRPLTDSPRSHRVRRAVFVTCLFFAGLLPAFLGGAGKLFFAGMILVGGGMILMEYFVLYLRRGRVINLFLYSLFHMAVFWMLLLLDGTAA
ncbi:MAG: protoheme IX farnesyltransferase [Candidatus Hydrogenedentota bacterium]|nr:MAG: protoheme IX farnesyltransferase [Candidatus Hydrogenedentota bacterium]